MDGEMHAKYIYDNDVYCLETLLLNCNMTQGIQNITYYTLLHTTQNGCNYIFILRLVYIYTFVTGITLKHADHRDV